MELADRSCLVGNCGQRDRAYWPLILVDNFGQRHGACYPLILVDNFGQSHEAYWPLMLVDNCGQRHGVWWPLLKTAQADTHQTHAVAEGLRPPHAANHRIGLQDMVLHLCLPRNDVWYCIPWRKDGFNQYNCYSEAGIASEEDFIFQHELIQTKED